MLVIQKVVKIGTTSTSNNMKWISNNNPVISYIIIFFCIMNIFDIQDDFNLSNVFNVGTFFTCEVSHSVLLLLLSTGSENVSHH